MIYQTIEKETILYVDDTTEMIKAQNIEELNMKIQEEANRSVQWMDQNRMKISEDKTKILVSSTRALRNLHQQPVAVTIKGIKVKETKSEKILGITFSNDLTWKHHLYGKDEHTGLIPKLQARAKIIHRLMMKVKRKWKQ